jgi:hypothetical protein
LELHNPKQCVGLRRAFKVENASVVQVSSLLLKDLEQTAIEKVSCTTQSFLE